MLRPAILLSIFFVTCHGYISLQNASWPINNAMNCTKPGYFCITCKEVVYCEFQPDGSLIGFVTDTCLGNQTCVEKASRSAQCTSEYNEDCDPSIEAYQFVCQQGGIFPDPFNCTKYHVCMEKDKDQVSEGEACPPGFGFDTRNLVCSIKLINGKCKGPVRPCKDMGQGPIPRNLRFYYACRKNPATDDTMFFPFLYHCAGEFIYLGDRCVDPSLPQNVVNNLCTTKGGFYHPKCTNYTYCSAPGTAPEIRSCYPGDYYDPMYGTCIALHCNWLLQ